MINLINGDCLAELDKLEENSIDCIVTDPPYELNFMGKGWDNAGISFQKETWTKCLKVLKPGGHLLAFGGSRTFHRIACAIEDGGFEIRDTIMWLYGSGFPKSMNIGLAIDKKNGVESEVVGVGKSGSADTHTRCMNSITQNGTDVFGGEYEIKVAKNKWNGWGTALKPAFEPIIVARKPFKGSLIDNIEKYGVGGINIDECRVGTDTIKGGTMPDLSYVGEEQKKLGNGHKMSFGQVSNAPRIECEDHIGRFPANLILTYDQMTFDEVCGGFPNTKSQKTNSKLLDIRGNNYNNANKNLDIAYERGYNDEGNASRYFYCAKASKKDRDEGLDNFEDKTKIFNGKSNTSSKNIKDVEQRFTTIAKNIHPTVKPTELMQYLVRLVAPNNAIILDPFMGSGTTGKAIIYENIEKDKNYSFIGIEKETQYYEIAKARIEYARNKMNNNINQILQQDENEIKKNIIDIQENLPINQIICGNSYELI